jgi:hypothetical protein
MLQWEEKGLHDSVGIFRNMELNRMFSRWMLNPVPLWTGPSLNP